MAVDGSRCGVVVLAGDRGGRGAGLAAGFARRGHPVVFVAPGLAAGGRPWEQRGTGADGVRSVVLGSAQARHAEERWSGTDLEIARAGLAGAIAALGLRCPALIVQSPGWRHLVGVMRARTEYPIVCDLAAADAVATGLADVADVVLAHSGPAANGLRARRADVIEVPDGCDAERGPPDTGPRLSPPLRGPLIGYAGDGRVHAALLFALAELRPDWTFPIVGRPDPEDLSRLDELDNVVVLPSVAGADRHRYAQEFDVGLVPLDTGDRSWDRYPVEVLELLGSGTPVVATPHPDLYPLQPVGVSIGATAPELAAAVERALAEPHDPEPGRQAAAAAGWDERVARFAHRLEASLPSLDVVVVSYDNAEALGHCLHSIERDRSHPARLIVVDNASGPETGALVAAAGERGAVVERLPQNVGFPAAVNHGLACAEGRYVLILNDDVQLPAGGLLAFVDTLARSRAVGLAGPVTNRIANEACIDVGYEERHPAPDVVDRVHAERAARHPGVSADIGVAALFAAAARKADLDAIGGLSERFQLGQFDDDDLSHRIRTQLGMRVVCCDDVFVHHAGMSAFGALDPHLLDGLFSRNRRVFETSTQSTWRPHRRRDAPREPDPDPEETTMDPSAHADPRVAELESELSAVRRDYQDKLLAATRGAPNGAHAPAPDAGLYEMLLSLERERSDARAHVHAEYLRRVEAETERDRLAEVNADLVRQRDEADARAALFIGQVRTLEASLAWRLGRALLDPVKRLPGLRRLAGR